MALWIRLDCNASQCGWTHRLDDAGFGAFCKLLVIIKVHGARGSIKLSDAADLAKGHSTTIQAIQRVIDASDGHLTVEAGRVTVKNWSRYQMDTTHADRQAAYRLRKRQNTETSDGSDSGDVCDVCDDNRTEQNRTERERGSNASDGNTVTHQNEPEQPPSEDEAQPERTGTEGTINQAELTMCVKTFCRVARWVGHTGRVYEAMRDLIRQHGPERVLQEIARCKPGDKPWTLADRLNGNSVGKVNWERLAQ